MAQTPNVFVIFHRDPQGTPDFIYSYDSRLAGCITLSINIARAYLRNVTVQAALVSFAKDLDRSLPKNAWYNDPVHGCGGPAGAVSAFIGIILSVFPLIAVDDSQSNPDVLAYVGKRAWDGRFEPLEHPIMLNGQRVHDMVEAATRARRTMDKSNDDNKQYRTFTFIFAHAIFHELCHLFSTFLTKGQFWTPVQCSAEIKGYGAEYKGEAGRYMENTLFGGTLEYYRDRSRGDGQSGLPHIINKDGVRRIPQETINAVNNYQFQFPYRLQSPISNPNDFESLGKGQTQDQPSDPMTWPIMQDFKRYKHTVTFHPRPDFQRPTYPPGHGASDPVGRPPRTSGTML